MDGLPNKNLKQRNNAESGNNKQKMGVFMTPKRSKMPWSFKPWAKAKEWAAKSSISTKIEGRGVIFARPFNPTQTHNERGTDKGMTLERLFNPTRTGIGITLTRPFNLPELPKRGRKQRYDPRKTFQPYPNLC